MSPHPRLLWCVGLVCALMAVSILAPSLRPVGLLLNLLLLVAVAADLVVTPSPNSIAVRRETSPVLSVNAPNPVTLVLENRSQRPLTVDLDDDPPRPSDTTSLPQTLELRPWAEIEVVYSLTPKKRGKNQFRWVHLRYPTLYRLFYRSERRPLVQEVRIYPDIRTVARFDLLARKNRLAEMGLKMWRLKGQGGEFERLREYRLEDEVRQVDWKASAKHRRLISREFTVERNQNIILLLDCGRSMGNEYEGVTHLDRGLNASIMLGYIALGQGDNVTMLAFSNRIERTVGPVRGKPAVQSLIQSTFDLDPQWEASDYDLVWEELGRKQRKRSLVVLLTHALDEQHLVSIGRYAKIRSSNHLILLVFLKDVGLAELAAKIPRDDVEAFHAAAAAEMIGHHSRRVEELRNAGIFVLETLPQELSSAVINQYLDLKARHLL